MRKNLLLGLAALAAVTLSSCQKDQVVNQVEEQDAIEFSTYVGRNAQTKASVVGLEELKTGFGVFAYHHENAFSDASELNFMFNEKVYFGADWMYDNTKYWPNDGNLSFFAYAPYIEDVAANDIFNGLHTLNQDGAPVLKILIPTDVSKQSDLLYADPIKDVNKGTVNSNNNDADHSSPEGVINFKFNHALSKIGFSVQTESNQKVAIKEITLSGKFNSQGDISLNDGTYSLTDNSTSQDYALSYDYSNYISGGAPTPINATEGYIMVIPTNLSSDNITIEVTYKMKDLLGNETGDIEASKTITGVNFQQGFAYTYNLILNPNDPIVFGQPTVMPWTDVTPSTDVTPVTVTP